ncbi:MAG TPA: hypothetical protein VGV35_20655 [Bryobacteraceae bacterium]|nr:hypothetical protein [Bryobacteraceae bacterium]
MQPVEPQAPLEAAVEPRRVSWVHRLGALLFILVCFEVGVFLLVFPWMNYWDNNWIAGVAPWVRSIWINAYFRGALSGLGLLNIYISLAEVFRLRRPAADRLKVSAL